jgi:hypothetical protein
MVGEKATGCAGFIAGFYFVLTDEKAFAGLADLVGLIFTPPPAGV